MKSTKLMCSIALAVFAALAIPVRLAAQKKERPAPRYSITDLGTLGGAFSQAYGINNKGEVVGFATTPGDTETHAFLWRNGRMTDLGTLGGPIGLASSVNERDEVVGFSDTSIIDPLGENFFLCNFNTGLICLPFLLQDGVMSPLSTLGGSNGQAYEINNRGQVVGEAENATSDPTCIAPQVLQFKPVIWEKGEIHELPTFSGDSDGVAFAINNRGQAVGVTANCNLVPGHAVVWHNGTVTNLGTLGDLALAPSDINNEGQVVGTAFDPIGTTNLAFLWQKGVASNLGTLPGDVQSHSNSINDRGQVAGQSCSISSCSAFLWQNGTMTDLNSLIPANSSLFLFDPGKINARGEIVGLAITSTGEGHAFLASPIMDEESEGESVSSVPQRRTNPPSMVTLPENVRGMLQRRLGQLYPFPGLGGRLPR